MIAEVAFYVADAAVYLGIGILPARRFADHVYRARRDDMIESENAWVARRVGVIEARNAKYGTHDVPDLSGRHEMTPLDGLPSAVATFIAVDVAWLPLSLYNLATLVSRDTLRGLIPSYRAEMARYRETAGERRLAEAQTEIAEQHKALGIKPSKEERAG